MPWQGHLFIGQPVRNYQELRDILTKLGIENDKTPDDELFDGSMCKAVELELKGATYKASIVAYWEQEGGARFPATSGCSDAAVALNLTSRYRGAILDAAYTRGGRPEPFVFDPNDILELLRQVREFWPEAQALIWDHHY